jgi:ribosomal protein S18 acetylase RimI-like enzyme
LASVVQQSALDPLKEDWLFRQDVSPPIGCYSTINTKSQKDATMTALRTMSVSEFEAWLEQSIKEYAADKVAAGQWLESESIDLSRKENDELLPLGLQTPDNHFFTIAGVESESVGVLWFAVKKKFNAPIAFVFELAVWPEHQRQGHASRALLALEEEVRRQGLSGIALHVFGHNTSARALYAKLGYEPTNITLFKAVPSAGHQPVDLAPG